MQYYLVIVTNPPFNGRPANIQIRVASCGMLHLEEARELGAALKKAIELAEERQLAYDAKLTEFQARPKEAKPTCDCRTCGTRRR